MVHIIIVHRLGLWYVQLDQLGHDPLVESISYVDLQRHRN